MKRAGLRTDVPEISITGEDVKPMEVFDVVQRAFNYSLSLLNGTLQPCIEMGGGHAEL